MEDHLSEKNQTIMKSCWEQCRQITCILGACGFDSVYFFEKCAKQADEIQTDFLNQVLKENPELRKKH